MSRRTANERRREEERARLADQLEKDGPSADLLDQIARWGGDAIVRTWGGRSVEARKAQGLGRLLAAYYLTSGVDDAEPDSMTYVPSDDGWDLFVRSRSRGTVRNRPRPSVKARRRVRRDRPARIRGGCGDGHWIAARPHRSARTPNGRAHGRRADAPGDRRPDRGGRRPSCTLPTVDGPRLAAPGPEALGVAGAVTPLPALAGEGYTPPQTIVARALSSHGQRLHRLAGRVGGFARAARYDGREMTAAARSTFAASFLTGHGCRVCPRVDLPGDLMPGERARRAEALRRGHYARVALAGVRARRARKAGQ